MQIDLFVRIVESCEANSHFFFTCRRNTADLLGLSSIQKISMSMRVIAYDIPTDYTDEYLHTLKCMWLFAKVLIKVFGAKYLRAPNNEDMKRVMAMNEK